MSALVTHPTGVVRDWRATSPAGLQNIAPSIWQWDEPAEIAEGDLVRMPCGAFFVEYVARDRKTMELSAFGIPIYGGEGEIRTPETI